jgi:hypothetical protein
VVYFICFLNVLASCTVNIAFLRFCVSLEKLEGRFSLDNTVDWGPGARANSGTGTTATRSSGGIDAHRYHLEAIAARDACLTAAAADRLLGHAVEHCPRLEKVVGGVDQSSQTGQRIGLLLRRYDTIVVIKNQMLRIRTSPGSGS